MNLTETPEVVYWPETHYIYLEKVGPFMQTAPQAWQQVQNLVPAIVSHNTITGFLSLYRMESKIYRAGVSVAAPPANLPEGLRYQKFDGGKYTRFVFTGPYPQLGEATARAVEIVIEKQIPLRGGFNIENYVNDPRTTPESELITEILFPIE